MSTVYMHHYMIEIIHTTYYTIFRNKPRPAGQRRIYFGVAKCLQKHIMNHLHL